MRAVEPRRRSKVSSYAFEAFSGQNASALALDTRREHQEHLFAQLNLNEPVTEMGENLHAAGNLRLVLIRFASRAGPPWSETKG